MVIAESNPFTNTTSAFSSSRTLLEISKICGRGFDEEIHFIRITYVFVEELAGEVEASLDVDVGRCGIEDSELF